MKKLEVLVVILESLDREGKRLYASVKFKLAFKLTTLGMTSIHFPCEEFIKFCKQSKIRLIIQKIQNFKTVQ